MHLSSEMISSQPTLESRNAAFLLMNLKSLAKEELGKVSTAAHTSPGSRFRVVSRLIPSQLAPQRTFSASEEDQSDDEEEVEAGQEELKERFKHTRLRTVSVSSQDASFQVSPLRSSPSPEEEDDEHEESSPSWPELSSFHDGNNGAKKNMASLGERLSEVFNKPPSTKLVGMTAEAPVKDVLKKKFSWKNYPELENYLIDNRDQYLRYSSQLNYTSEQKQYNNKLTQGLLDLASSEGYIFEDFTFAAIRDRIRCYYKSFVQAVKKKKRKKRV